MCSEAFSKSSSIRSQNQHKKTEVVHPPATGKLYSEPTITVNKQKLKVVDKFTYLENTLSRTVHIDDEVTARIAKASVAFRKRYK